ncbi:MAG TPA: AI-2E family transporter [Candidatus Limnocylindria bacterium]|nr:AI-2E family transporter [Candidatus Limnocylindria bacterium]
MADLLSALRRNRVGLFVLAVGVLLALLVWQVRSALPAFFIAIALAFILDPVVSFLQRRGVPRWGGVLVAYVLLIGVIWLVIAFALPPLAEQTRELIDRLPELGAEVTNVQRAILQWYASLPLPADVRAVIDESIAGANQAFGEAVRQILGPAFSAVLRTAGFLLGLIVIPVWLFFLLKDREGLPRNVRKALPVGWHADADNVLSLLAITGGRWVRGQLLLGAAIFLATVIGLTLLTVAGFGEFGRFTLVLALIAGVLEWFPIIGPIVAAIPAILIGLTISPAAAIAAAVLYTAIQQLENNVLVPKVLGDAVKLHPAVMIFALVVGGALFGIGGAILAAPVVATGRDLYRYAFERLHERPPEAAYAVAIGAGATAVNEPPPPEPQTEASVGEGKEEPALD